MTRRLFMAAALAAAFAVLGQSPSDLSPQRLSQQSTEVLRVPGTTSGAYFEETPETVFNWNADEWNRVRFPEALAQSPWGGAAAVTVTSDTDTAPNGTQTADTLTINAPSSSSARAQSFGTLPAGTYTGSLHLKAGTTDRLNVGLYCGSWLAHTSYVVSGPGATSTPYGAVGTVPGITSLSTTAWTRVAFTYTTPGGVTCTMNIYPQSSGAQAAGNSIKVWGAQLVRGPVALPYKSRPGSTVGGAGDTLVMNGTVPLVTSTAAWPRGFGAGRRGAGPYSVGNYFSLTDPPTRFVGDHTICMVAKPNAFTITTDPLATLNAAATNGTYFQNYTAGTISYRSVSAGTDTGTVVTAAMTLGALNIVCGGRSGSIIYAKVNGTTTTTATAAGLPVWSTQPLTVGSWNNTAAFAGTIHEIWASSTPWSESNVAQIQARAMALGNSDEPLFLPDASTVLHLRGDAFDGTTWKSPQGALTTVGTVDYTDGWVPPVAGTRQAVGYGAPFSDANYLSFGTAVDAMDLPAPWSYCVAYTPAANYSASGRPYTNGDTTSKGSSISVQTNGVYHIINGTSNGAGSATFGALNVTCCGYDGVSSICKTNRGALATNATAYSLGTTVQAYFGRSNGVGVSFNGSVHAFWASTQTPSDALFTSIIDRALGQTDAANRPVSVTRTTTETYEIPGPAQPTLFTAPAGVAAVGPSGTQVWRQSTNITRQSQTSCVGNAVQAPWTAAADLTCLSDAGIAPDGTTTMDEWTNTVNTSNPTIGSHILSGTKNAITFSAWLAKPSGTGTAELLTYNALCTNPICTCRRSDGRVCTPTVFSGTGCRAKVTDLGTTPVRLSVTKQCPVSIAALAIYVAPGERGVSTGTVRFWGSQVEELPYETPYIATTTANVQRNADAISAAHGLLPGDRSWCVSGTYTPGTWTWNSPVEHGLWSMGTEGQANSAWLGLRDGLLTFGVKSASWQDGVVTFDTASTGALTTREPHTVKACVVDGSRVALWWDGRPVAAASNGGDLTWTPPSTIRFGSHSTAGAEWDGGIHDLRVERATFSKTEVSALDEITLGSYQFATTGQTIPENILGDASKVTAHLVWNGTALVDTRGGTWPMTGVVPQVTTGPGYPQGFASAPKPGAGPFAAGNYYSASAADGVFDVTGDFIVCAVVDGNPATGTAQWWVADSVTGVSGWRGFVGTAGQLGIRFESPGASSMTPANNGVFGLNVLCAGRAALVGWAKLNLGTATTMVLPAQAAATTTVARIGQTNFATEPLTMTLRELIFFNGETPTDAKLITIQRHVLGLTGNAAATSQQAVSLTRTTTKTCELPDEGGTVYTVPAAAPCIGKKGLQVEPTRTNSLQYSSASCVGGAVQAPWTLTGTPTCLSDAGIAPDGTTTVDEWTNTVNTDSVYQTATIASSTTVTGSVWAAKPVGTGIVSLLPQCSGVATASACSCGTSDGSPCTTTPNGAYCSTKFTTVGTTPIRVWSTVTCSVAITIAYLTLVPGDRAVSTGTARFWGAQLEAGAHTTSYIPTPGAAAVQRNADVAAVANPLTATNPADWCMSVTGTPEYGRAWALTEGFPGLWSLGAYSAANTAAAFFYGSLDVRDSTGASRVQEGAYPGATTGQGLAIQNCDATGFVRSYSNGTVNTAAAIGVGTGVISTQPATVYLGGNAAGNIAAAGYLRNFRICATADNRRCY